MFRRAAVFPVCLAGGEICLYLSTCRFPPFDAKKRAKALFFYILFFDII